MTNKTSRPSTALNKPVALLQSWLAAAAQRSPGTPFTHPPPALTHPAPQRISCPGRGCGTTAPGRAPGACARARASAEGFGGRRPGLGRGRVGGRRAVGVLSRALLAGRTPALITYASPSLHHPLTQSHTQSHARAQGTRAPPAAAARSGPGRRPHLVAQQGREVVVVAVGQAKVAVEGAVGQLWGVGWVGCEGGGVGGRRGAAAAEGYVNW